MKEHFVSRRKRTHKLKLLISFNGTFCCRPPFRKFGYNGGETRIISVDRNITFSKLKSKIITDLLPPNSAVSASPGFHFSLKYHISASFCGVDGKAGEAPVLILLETDDDVRCMLEEYEAMEFNGEFFARLWVFVCDPIRRDKHEIYGFFEGRKVFPGIQGIQTLREGEGFLSEDFLTLFGKKTRDSAATDHRSRKFTDNSLVKKVLRQQLLAKKLDEQTEMELTGENRNCEAPLIELCSEPEGPPTFLSKETNFGGNLARKVTDYKHVNPHTRAGDESFGKVLPLTRSDSLPLNPKDGNSRLGSDGSNSKTFGSESSCSFRNSSEFAAAGQPLKLSKYSGVSTMSNGLEANYDFISSDWTSFSYRDRENIMPWGGESGDTIVKRNDPFPPSGHNQLTGNQNPLRPSQDSVRNQEGYGCGGDIHNHRFSSNEARSQRTCPYHIKSRALVNEMGNNSNFRFDGRPVGKFYPFLRCSSNISKQRPVLRSYSDASRKTLTYSCHHKGEEVYGKMVCALNNRTKTFDLPYRGQEENPMRTGFHRVVKHERVNPGEGRMAYDGACVRANNRSPIPFDAAVSTLPHAIAVDTQVDLLTGPGSEELQIAYQGLSTKTFDEMGTTGEAPLNISQGMNLRTQEDDIYSCHPNNLSYSSGAELSYNYKYMGTESGQGFKIERSGVHTWDVHATSPADLSMQNLSLATSSKLHLSSPSCAIIDNCQSLLTPDSNDLDLMDEEPLNSAPKVEKSSDIFSDSSSDNDARLGKDDKEKQEIQQVVVANLSTEEKDENGKTNKCLKANGALPADIAAFFSLLSTRELQNIRNSDLECIKELGSGTFGTVYYGKWKGTDVAIKRIKRSCFTDGAKEEDRLVADFWKEAHILGQLRHPNIVALYGVATDGPVNSLATVTEYMVNGSLKQVLRKKDRTIDRRKRLIIAMDATCGMEYLHEKNIVHFDLKSHNFLMNMRDPHRPVCKIGDLGLSKIKQRTLVSGGVRGTIPWMAPELLNGNKLVSEKVDVYSFAIVMWELLTGEEPYGDMRSEEIIAGIIRGNLRPEIPSWCEPAWRSLMERCWSSDPDSRPPFSEIAKELRAMAASMKTK